MCVCGGHWSGSSAEQVVGRGKQSSQRQERRRSCSAWKVEEEVVVGKPRAEREGRGLDVDVEVEGGSKGF
jgi:hypothetical protein